MSSNKLPQLKVNPVLSLFSSGQFVDTLDAIDLLKKEYPKEELLCNIKGACYAGLKDFDAAIESYKEALLINPNYAKAHYNLGDALHQLKNYDEAVQSYKSSIKIDSNFAEAHNNLGNIYKELNQLDKAIKSYQKALKLKPNYAEAHFSIAISFQLLNEFGKMIEHLEALCTIQPNFFEAYNYLGIALKETGQFQSSIKAYEKALSIKSDYVEAHNNLGNVFKELGQLNEAVDSYQKAISINSEYPTLQNNLGNALKELGKMDEAVDAYEKALILNPENPDTHNNLGEVFRDLNKLEKSVKHYKEAIHLDSNNFDAHNNIGTVFRELNQFDEAIRSYKKAISIYPEYAEAFNNIGNIFKEQDQFDHAVDSYKMALSIDPYYFEAYFNLGVAHQKHGSSSDAINSYMKVLEINPEYVDAHNNLANIFQELGQIDKAINGYTKALKIDPTIAKIHRNLSILKKYKEVDSQILQMRDLISREEVDISDRINLYFALAKAYRDLGNKDELFKFLNKGNQLRKKQLNYSLKEDQDRHFSYRNFFESSSSVLTESLKFESTNVRPIFIIGMPRSGTTLLEQIFSSHTAVYGAGESVTLIKVISKLVSKLLIDNTKLSKNNLQSIRQEYLNFLSSLDINESIITDKMPTNFEYIGFILKAIPEAKIIHIKRDPMATCWSIYFNYFSARGLGFPYSMDDLSGYYKSYIDLMNYWHTAFPNKIYDISYEDLTVNQEIETRKLLEYCELEWDENCLNFHNSQRSVKTASSIQVRKKMYQGSSEVWKKYEDYLQPLIKGLNYY